MFVLKDTKPQQIKKLDQNIHAIETMRKRILFGSKQQPTFPKMCLDSSSKIDIKRLVMQSNSRNITVYTVKTIEKFIGTGNSIANA